MATQKVVEGHEIEVRVPPASTGSADHFLLCQKMAEPFSSTAIQNTAVGHDTPKSEEEAADGPLDSIRIGADQVALPLATELVVAEHAHATIVITAETNINRRRRTHQYLPT